ncbi:hypothetical protein ILYODFUR_025044 [Ilyodon furcidens]|uniref:Lactosylceramide alpha-2,3-sialyltransferase n=1 Tax=Ilyodon furcidens TaxID=33524 RepID=A0ABV0SQU8_9TELE
MRLMRRVLVALVLSLGMISLTLLQTRPEQPVERHVSPAHKQLVHKYVHSVLESQCHPRDSREKLLAHFLSSSEAIHPFLWNDEQLPDDLFLHPPPFGFKGLKVKVQELLKLLPAPDSGPLPEKVSGKCQRCVVIGNGGILKGLELGQLIDRFDTIIRSDYGNHCFT